MLTSFFSLKLFFLSAELSSLSQVDLSLGLSREALPWWLPDRTQEALPASPTPQPPPASPQDIISLPFLAARTRLAGLAGLGEVTEQI